MQPQLRLGPAAAIDAIRHASEPRRALLRAVLIVGVAAWAIVIVQHGTAPRDALNPADAAAATPGRPATTTDPIGR